MRWSTATTIKTKAPATTVAFASGDLHARQNILFGTSGAADNNYRRRHLAIGLESGDIVIYSNKVGSSASDWGTELSIDTRFGTFHGHFPYIYVLFRFSMAHVDHIHRLSWRPMVGSSSELASCGEDGTLRILKVQLTTD